MARLLGPDANSRLVYALVGGSLASTAGKTATIYSDAAGTLLADIATYDGSQTPGAVISGSTVTVDSNSLLPKFWFPAAGTDTLYAKVGTGPVTAINADYDARLDAFTGVNYRGTWAASTAYAVNDLASLGGELLLCTNAHTSSSAFSLTNWSNLTGKPGHYNVMLYGAKGDDSTDDTAAIQAAISAAVTAEVSSGRNYAEIVFPAARYVLSSATTKSASNKGNAQIWLPLIATTVQKFTLVLRGVRQAGALPHWQQTTALKSGSVLRTTLTGQTVDGTWGPPSVIGGPTPAQGYGFSASLFNNMLVVVDGISVVTPANPSLVGMDFSGMAQAHIISASVNASTTPGSGTPTTPTNSWAYGVYMPQMLNNDKSDIDDFSAEGMYSGLTVSEHTTITRCRVIYCIVGITLVGNMSDSIWIGYASIESCQYDLQEAAINGGTGTTVYIALLDVEEVSGGGFDHQKTVDDGSNNLRGYIGCHILTKTGTQGGEPTVNGATKVKVVNLGTAPGASSSPSLPSSTVASTPFFRDVFIAVTGGTTTAASIDGVAQGFTTTPFTLFVPAGKTFAITYSGAPTLKVTVL